MKFELPKTLKEVKNFKVPERKGLTMIEIEMNARKASRDKFPVEILEERVNNSVIKERLISDYVEHVKTGGKFYNTTNMADVMNYESFSSEAEIREYVETIINNLFTRTGISYDEKSTVLGLATDMPQKGFGSTEDHPDDDQRLKFHGGIFINAIDVHGEKYSDIDKMKTEAHEKGHNLRMYIGESSFTRKVQSVFELEKISLPENYINAIHSAYPHLSREDAVRERMSYIGNPLELLEKMSEIKNMLGFIGDEEFKQEHLKYVRKNFPKNLNGGTINLEKDIFLRCITPEKESAFIGLMNSIGV